MIDRAAVIGAASRVLAARAEQCRPEHAVIGAAIADELGLVEAASSIEEAVQAAAEPALDLGIWIDDAPSRVLTEAFLGRLRALPLSHVAVMVERSGGGLDLTWNTAQLSRLAHELPHHGRVLTLWPEPTKAYMERLGKALPGLMRAFDTGVVELDLEGHWKAAKVVGFASLAEAGKVLVKVLEQSAREATAALEIEVTTFPDHLEASGKGKVLGEARLLLQTYAVAEARGERRDFEGRMGPARRPYEDVVQARARGAEGEVCAGLAAWEQFDWPGGPDNAMRLALDSARRAGVRKVRYWSSRHILGASANSYAARAIESFRSLSLRRTP